jgi:hypothetical protein
MALAAFGEKRLRHSPAIAEATGERTAISCATSPMAPLDETK